MNDILKKHGAEGEEELGQAQFAELLQPILQDLADALAEKHVVVIQNVKIINGSKLRKVTCIGFFCPLVKTHEYKYLLKKLFHFSVFVR